MKKLARLTCLEGGFAMGLATLGAAQGVSSVNSIGVLKGYTVQQEGKEACRTPSVFIQFKGPRSHVFCD